VYINTFFKPPASNNKTLYKHSLPFVRAQLTRGLLVISSYKQNKTPLTPHNRLSQLIFINK